METCAVTAVDHAGQAVHLHDADGPGRGLEPDPVQLERLHAPRLRYQLHRDAPCSDPRQLPHPEVSARSPPRHSRSRPRSVPVCADRVSGAARIYFSDRLYTEDELPAEFRLLMPIAKKNRELAAHAERDATRKQAATETTNSKVALCDRSGDGIHNGGGGDDKATSTTGTSAGDAKIEEKGTSADGGQKGGDAAQPDGTVSAEKAGKNDGTSRAVSGGAEAVSADSAPPTVGDHPAVAT